MTHDEYRDERDEIVSNVPVEFRGVLIGFPNTLNLPDGREAVINELYELVEQFKPIIDQYKTNLLTRIANERLKKVIQ